MPPVSPEDVGDAPELLVLMSLDATLTALRVAVCAAFPELLSELGRQRDPPLLKAARQLADRACQLERASARYRRELERSRSAPTLLQDLPF